MSLTSGLMGLGVGLLLGAFGARAIGDVPAPRPSAVAVPWPEAEAEVVSTRFEILQARLDTMTRRLRAIPVHPMGERPSAPEAWLDPSEVAGLLTQLEQALKVLLESGTGSVPVVASVDLGRQQLLERLEDVTRLDKESERAAARRLERECLSWTPVEVARVFGMPDQHDDSKWEYDLRESSRRLRVDFRFQQGVVADVQVR